VPDLYEVLDLPRDAPPAAVRMAYRNAAKRAHPDGGGSPERFALVKTAYECLNDPERRARYDATGEVGETTPDNAEQAALQLALQAIDEVIVLCDKQGRDPENVDLIASAVGALKERRRAQDKGIEDAQDRVRKIRRMAKRFSAKKKKGVDRIGPMLDGQAINIERAAENAKRERDVTGRAIAILQDHDCKFTPAPARNYADEYAQALRSGGFFSNTSTTV
jgi:curved DNA-binding protein CbpA